MEEDNGALEFDLDACRKEKPAVGSVTLEGVEYPIRRPTLAEFETIEELPDGKISSIRPTLRILFGSDSGDALADKLTLDEVETIVGDVVPRLSAAKKKD